MINFLEGVKYRFEGVHDNLDRLWKASTIDAQVQFSPIVIHGTTTIDSEGTQFFIHNIGGSHIAIESCDHPGYFLTQFRDPDETHPHLRENMVVLEEGAPTDEVRMFNVSEPIWTGGAHVSSELFTLKWTHFVLVSGVGGLLLAPYTTDPHKNWGFVFRAVTHAYQITLSTGTFEFPPFNFGGYSTPAMAAGIFLSFVYGGHGGWRLPSPEEMEAVLSFYNTSNIPQAQANFWTNKVASPGRQVIVSADGMGGISRGTMGVSYAFGNHVLAVRTI